MTPGEIERVFGRGRLKMATGEHVEVYREAVAPGERRRYTKRFLSTREGDFGQWTEREWRILARLIGHGITCVPEVVQFDRGRVGGSRIVQTYDAGVTVDQWATLLPMMRDGRVHRHVFEDCAHWWALAHHALRALEEIHRLELVHLDVKGDNVCIPYAPASFDPDSPETELRPLFAQFALIDFAFALVSREMLTTPLPIGWQKEYDYQSPRLLAALEAGRTGNLAPTRELDWRCDMYSLAAMLGRYLPEERGQAGTCWTPERFEAAKALIARVRDAHDADLPARWPHGELIETTLARLAEADLAASLERGWTLARAAAAASASASPLTPVTRVAPITRIATPIQVTRSGRTAVTVIAPAAIPDPIVSSPIPAQPPNAAGHSRRLRSTIAAAAAVLLVAAGAAVLYPQMRTSVSEEAGEAPFAPMRTASEVGGDAAAKRAPAGAVEGHAPSPKEPSTPSLAQGSTPSPSVPATSESPHERVASALPRARVETAPPGPRADRSEPGYGVAHPLPSVAALDSASVASEHRAQASSARHSQSKDAPAVRESTKSAAASTTRATSSAWPAPAPRTYASWASLKPPGWLKWRSHSPGDPPGYKTQLADAQGATTAIDPQSAKPLDAAGAEPAPQGPQPTPLAPAAAPAESVHIAPAPAPAATSGPIASSSPSSQRRSAPQTAPARSLFAAPSAAPVEDRSDKLEIALAPTAAGAGALAAGAVRSPAAPSAAEQSPRSDFSSPSRQMFADVLPRGEAEVSRVLLIAASAYQPAQDRNVANAARSTRIRDEALPAVQAAAQIEARRLHDQARAALASGRGAREALDRELRAFGANPRDPEIAGYLAVLYLKTTPPQPDLARQAALLALTARAPEFSTTRLEDWQTFAVASALAGREADARNALFVTLALTNNVEGRCIAGWNALASYGDRMRAPLEALLYRVHMRGHSVDSPWCAWPPDFSTPPRLAGVN